MTPPVRRPTSVPRRPRPPARGQGPRVQALAGWQACWRKQTSTRSWPARGRRSRLGRPWQSGSHAARCPASSWRLPACRRPSGNARLRQEQRRQRSGSSPRQSAAMHLQTASMIWNWTTEWVAWTLPASAGTPNLHCAPFSISNRSSWNKIYSMPIATLSSQGKMRSRRRRPGACLPRDMLSSPSAG